MTIFESCAAALLALTAVVAALSHSTRLVSPEEARHILGGAIALTYTWKTCGLSTDCGTIQCAPNPMGVMTCPNGSTQFTSSGRNYPVGTKPGNLFTAANPFVYSCGFDRACSTPCRQSTLPPNNWYCGGQVGPNAAHNVNGVVGNGVLPPNE